MHWPAGAPYETLVPAELSGSRVNLLRMATRSRRRRFFVWSLVAAFGAAALAGLAILVPNVIVTRSAGSHMISTPTDAPPAQCAIVLGARVYNDGTPSPMLADRLKTGIELYRLGKVDRILISGDHGQVEYDEVNAMLDYVVERGVPEEDVFTDHAGFSTYETMYRARDVFLVKTALVVTQEFHLARAVYTARKLGLEATGVAADLQPYVHETRFAVRDWLARVKAVIQLHVTHPLPRYLGPILPIDGDGRATRG